MRAHQIRHWVVGRNDQEGLREDPVSTERIYQYRASDLGVPVPYKSDFLLET